MSLLTREELLAPQPVKIEDYKISGGSIRLKEQTLSQSSKFQAWLKPKGKDASKRQQYKFLKLATMCLIDTADNLIFDFPDTKVGNQEFFEFVDSIKDDAASKWEEIELKAMKHNGYLDASEDDDLVGK